MTSQFIIPIVTKYGDKENAERDFQSLREIFNRQGSSLLIDLIAEVTRAAANKYKLGDESRRGLFRSLVDELRDALNESES